MVLDLKPVFAGVGKPLSFVYPLGLSSYELQTGEFPFRTPVTVKGSVENRAGVITLRVTASFDYSTRCDRCGREIAEHFDFPFRNVLVRRLEGEDAGEELLTVTEDEFSLDDYIVSNIVLALPLKHLCKSDCKGLCPRCGKDLNDGPCGCQTD